MTELHDDTDDIEAGGALPPGLFPIRVVSARTGVNTVTLRAWERRYGLLRPVRTPKGHRLYSEEDITRVEKIVAWINRGVSISRVRALLAHDEGDAPESEDSVGDWQDYTQRALRAVAQFDENRLDDLVNEALSLYPFPVVCERLIGPLAEHPAARADAAPGDRAAQSFVEGYLERKLAARVQLAARHVGGPAVIISALPGGVRNLSLLVLAAGFHAIDAPVLVLPAALPAEDLLVACDRRPARAIVLHGDVAQEPATLTKLLARLVTAQAAPVCVSGPAARIHEQRVVDAGACPLVDVALAALRLSSLPVQERGA